MDFFRKLFGLPSKPYSSSPSFGYIDEENTSTEPPDNGRNFNVFTDPLEMHRYFEQQMDTLFKSFGMPNFGHFFRALEEPHGDNPYQVEEFAPDSRDSFLKKDYEKPSYEYPSNSGKADKDLDGKLSLTELDALFSKPSEREAGFADENPFGRHSGSLQTFKKSVEVRTIRKPDGSYETQRIVTDSEGNKETTVTKKIGDKEHTTITRQDGKDITNRTEEDRAGSILFRPLFDEALLSQFFK